MKRIHALLAAALLGASLGAAAHGDEDHAKKAGPVIAYGNFVTVALNFVILAFIIFVMVRAINRLRARHEEEKKAAPPPEPPEEVQLLREIRDSLAAK